MTAHKITERVCCVCGANYGIEGPLPWCADQHRVDGELLMTCSQRCREERGFEERKNFARAAS